MATEKPPDRFTIHLPEAEEPEREMPDHLEMVDYQPDKRAKGLPAGAYNPYSKDIPTLSDTARIRKPRVDLRKLSEWIKNTQQVKALREQDLPPDTKLPDKD
ncbi:MAG TPA: hypothetical protein VMH77_09685 [Steroidobacteraceae bacterium]|nr:hypothetical protein [Steroidobacteraceae bacterium]